MTETLMIQRPHGAFEITKTAEGYGVTVLGGALNAEEEQQVADFVGDLKPYGVTGFHGAAPDLTDEQT